MTAISAGKGAGGVAVSENPGLSLSGPVRPVGQRGHLLACSRVVHARGSESDVGAMRDAASVSAVALLLWESWRRVVAVAGEAAAASGLLLTAWLAPASPACLVCPSARCSVVVIIE